MADTFIQLNTDGTGKKLDTRTEATNGEHRQVFVIGDPATNAGVAPVDATNGLSVNLTNTSIAATVSGVATAANQSTANTSLASIDTKTPATGQATMANSSPVVIASNQSAVPVSNASLPLPTGAATDATLTGGTQQSKVTDGSNTLSVATQGSTTTSQTGVLGMASVTTGSPSYTNGQTSPLSMSTSGSLRVTAGTSTASIGNVGSSTATGSAVPANAHYIGIQQSGGILNGLSAANNIGDGGGASALAAGTLIYNGATWDRQRSATSTNATTGTGLLGAGVLGFDGTNYQRIKTSTGGVVSVDGSATTQPVSGTVAANLTPSTSGGLTGFKVISAATTNATSVKASAGQVYGLQAFNTNAAPRYLKLYDKATAPTVGTDTPVRTILIPGNTAGAGVVIEQSNGMQFTSGIAIAVTTGITDADTTATAANEIVVNLGYK